MVFADSAVHGRSFEGDNCRGHVASSDASSTEKYQTSSGPAGTTKILGNYSGVVFGPHVELQPLVLDGGHTLCEGTDTNSTVVPVLSKAGGQGVAVMSTPSSSKLTSRQLARASAPGCARIMVTDPGAHPGPPATCPSQGTCVFFQKYSENNMVARKLFFPKNFNIIIIPEI